MAILEAAENLLRAGYSPAHDLYVSFGNNVETAGNCAAAAAELPYVSVNMAGAIAEGVSEFKAMGLVQAYCGAPAEASTDEGEQSYGVLAEMVGELALALVAGTGGRDAPGMFTRVAEGER